MTNRPGKDLHEHCKTALQGGNLGGQTDLEEILYHSHKLYTTGSSEHRTTPQSWLTRHIASLVPALHTCSLPSAFHCPSLSQVCHSKPHCAALSQVSPGSEWVPYSVTITFKGFFHYCVMAHTANSLATSTYKGTWT